MREQPRRLALPRSLASSVRIPGIGQMGKPASSSSCKGPGSGESLTAAHALGYLFYLKHPNCDVPKSDGSFGTYRTRRARYRAKRTLVCTKKARRRFNLRPSRFGSGAVPRRFIRPAVCGRNLFCDEPNPFHRLEPAPISKKPRDYGRTHRMAFEGGAAAPDSLSPCHAIANNPIGGRPRPAISASESRNLFTCLSYLDNVPLFGSRLVSEERRTATL